MSNRRPCQFYLRGSCRFGDNCRDYHPNGSMFDQGINSRSGNVLSGTTTSGFGVGGGQFNPFSGSIGKPLGDMNSSFTSGGGTGMGPFGNFGGPFGGGGSGAIGVGNSSFGDGATSNPFGGGNTSTTGFIFGSSPFGSSVSGSGSSTISTTGPTTGSIFGSSPFGGSISGSGSTSAIGSSPFGSVVGGSGPISSSSSSSSSTGNVKPSKSDNPTLQILELIGVVVNSGVWPFGRIGLLNQSQDSSNSQVFPSLDLSIEEYRWKFYQSDPGNWNNLHLETLRLLTQQYNSFIEQGKIQSKLPATHQLYNLDFSLYSKIGNWYLPNLGKDYVNKPNNTNTGATTTINTNTNTNNTANTIGSITNPFGGTTLGFGQGTGLQSNNSNTSPFGVFGSSSASSSSIMSNNALSPFGGTGGGNGIGSGIVNNSVFGITNQSQIQSQQQQQQQQTSPFSGGNIQTNINQPFSIESNNNNNNFGIFGSQGTGSNISNNFNNIFGNITNQQNQTSNSGGTNIKYSYNNPDVNDDNHSFNSQNLQEWELNAFKSSTFEENKIPEKIPPRYLRTYT
ncbi:CCCH like finger domain nucleoporin [Cryptosporidium hominis]